MYVEITITSFTSITWASNRDYNEYHITWSIVGTIAKIAMYQFIDV